MSSCPQSRTGHALPHAPHPRAHAQIAGVREILTSVVQALEEDESRRFSWADMSFFIRSVGGGQAPAGVFGIVPVGSQQVYSKHACSALLQHTSFCTRWAGAGSCWVVSHCAVAQAYKALLQLRSFFSRWAGAALCSDVLLGSLNNCVLIAVSRLQQRIGPARRLSSARLGLL